MTDDLSGAGNFEPELRELRREVSRLRDQIDLYMKQRDEAEDDRAKLRAQLAAAEQRAERLAARVEQLKGALKESDAVLAAHPERRRAMSTCDVCMRDVDDGVACADCQYPDPDEHNKVLTELDLLRIQRDELRDVLETVLPYAEKFWRSGEQPASCIAEASAAIARVRRGE